MKPRVKKNKDRVKNKGKRKEKALDKGLRNGKKPAES